jgi:HemY protein
MILRVIAAFGVLILSLYLGIFLRQDPGYVLIMFRHWTIESTFWIAAIAILAGIIILHLTFNLCRNIARIPIYWRQWRHDLRLSRAQAKTKRGLIEFSEGQWQTAKKHLIAAAPNASQPLVNYLTAAKAAEKLGDHDSRDRYLHLAQTAAPDATIAIELTQAQLQIDNQEWREATATLEALEIITPEHPLVLQLSLELYQATQNWKQLLALLPKLKPNKNFSERDIYETKKNAYLALLQDHIQHANSDVDLQHTIAHLPKELRHDPELVAWYARYLLTHHQDELAEKYLRDGLKQHMSAELMALYSQIHPEYARIPFLESLCKQDPQSAPLHLCLGQLFLAKEVWGSARTHLEKSIAIQPSSQAYYALGVLLEKLDKPSDACRAYREGLEQLQ